MYRIVSIHSLKREEFDRELLAAMNDRLAHRGPDSHGSHLVPAAVVLGIRRLANIAVAGGDQPIANETGSVWIVFNGEIHIFLELRRDLEARERGRQPAALVRQDGQSRLLPRT